jgi:hypothetical protein
MLKIDTSNKQQNEKELEAALDDSIQAAFALGISERDLLHRIEEKMRLNSNDKLALAEQEKWKLYNPEAGP